MKWLTVIFVLGITLNVSLGMSFRYKRQLSDDEDENTLDDRYGWNRPSWERPQRPNQGNQWPNQGNQWPQPNQGGNQFPEPNQGGNQWPQPNQGGNQPQPTPVPNGNGSTTQSSAVQDCIRNCPVTSEYNPVCGTNLVQYTNPGRLSCAQSCGINVNLLRSSPCPTTTTTTAAPVG